MPKFLALASAALLMLGTAAAMTKSDAENPGTSTNKGVERCCSQFQKLADKKTDPQEAGRTKRSAGDDFDPASGPLRKCANGKLCRLPISRTTGSTGPTVPPKPIGSQK